MAHTHEKQFSSSSAQSLKLVIQLYQIGKKIKIKKQYKKYILFSQVNMQSDLKISITFSISE